MENMTLAIQGSNKTYRDQKLTNKNGNSISFGDIKHGLTISRIKEFAKAALYNKDLAIYLLEDGEQTETMRTFDNDWKGALRLLSSII